MTRPVRLQLSRKAGFRLQEHSRAVNGLPAIFCARHSAFGNPFVVGRGPDRWQARRWCWELDKREEWHVCKDASEAEQLFADRLAADELSQMRVQNHLRGVNCACWCGPNDPCHLRSLMLVANGFRCDTPFSDTQEGG